jgi:hypothetical protein
MQLPANTYKASGCQEQKDTIRVRERVVSGLQNSVKQ